MLSLFSVSLSCSCRQMKSIDKDIVYEEKEQFVPYMMLRAMASPNSKIIIYFLSETPIISLLVPITFPI